MRTRHLERLREEICLIQEKLKDLRTERRGLIQESNLPADISVSLEARMRIERESFINAFVNLPQVEGLRVGIELLEPYLQQKQIELREILENSIAAYHKQIKTLEGYLKSKQAELNHELSNTQRAALERSIVRGFEQIKAQEACIRELTELMP